VRVGLDELVGALDEPPRRLALHVAPGDFVNLDVPLAEVWPARDAERLEVAVHGAVAIGDERDLSQDIGFGLRQLADIAVRALSPGINDPTTAVTCVGYLRSLLVRLAGRAYSGVRRFPERDLVVVAALRTFEEHVATLLEVGRYARGDARVAESVLRALDAVAEAARRAGAEERARHVGGVATALARQALEEAGNDADRGAVRRLLAELPALGAAELHAQASPRASAARSS
jgi:uncharacterized membrane protein